MMKSIRQKIACASVFTLFMGALFGVSLQTGCTGDQTSGSIDPLTPNGSEALEDTLVATIEGQPVEVTVATNGSELSISEFAVIREPDHGILESFVESSSNEVTIRYTPAEDFVGDDSFDVELRQDGIQVDQATVTVRVYPEVRFTLEVMDESTDLLVQASAFTPSGHPLPDGDYIWKFDDDAENGPVATHGNRQHTFSLNGTHVVSLTLALSAFGAFDCSYGPTGNSKEGSVAASQPPGPGDLVVIPDSQFNAIGKLGGPFNPSSVTYKLTNTSRRSLTWTASKSSEWLTLSKAGGILAAGAEDTVDAVLGAAAYEMPVGQYSDMVEFINASGSQDNIARAASLTINQLESMPGELALTPNEGMSVSGAVGGPFDPESADYTLTNVGEEPINWGATKTKEWVNISSEGGTLTAGASTTLTVSIDARASGYEANHYSDAVTLTNQTNGLGDTSIPVDMEIVAPGGLLLTPGTNLSTSGPVGGPFNPNSFAYFVSNTGNSPITWTATKTRNWITLSTSGGTLAAGNTTTLTVFVNASANALSAGTSTDTVSITNLTNGIGSTTRDVSIVVQPAGTLAVTESANLTSTGPVGGPFSPSQQTYTLLNTGSTSFNWTASKTRSWVTLSSSGGTLAAGASTTVTVSLNSGANSLAAGTFTDTVTFANTTNGNGNTTRGVSITAIAPAGALSVVESADFSSSGTQGGPFSPNQQVYTLQNTGGSSLNWTASKTRNWVSLSASSGTLTAGATTTLTVSINSNANSLTTGSYGDTVTFTNTTDGNGNTDRDVSLMVNAPAGSLSVTSGSNFSSSGMQGGPFSPSQKSYTLQNMGGSSISWTAAKNQSWITLSSSGGTLAAGATVSVVVSVNSGANSLAAGSYSDTVTFTNTTNSSGNTTRGVSLTVNATAGALSVTASSGLSSTGTQGGPFSPSQKSYTLQNTGGTSINWTASKTQSWVTLSGTSGSLAAGATTTIVVSINSGANSLAAGSFSDTVTFTNSTNSAGNTTRSVSLTVNPTPGVLLITPSSNMSSSGNQGGPFTPNSKLYTIQNTGGTTIDFTISKTQSWVSLSGTSGTLAPGETDAVQITFNGAANSLTAGTYTDTITFTNTTNGTGNTSRSVSLTVNAGAGALSVTSSSGLTGTGPQGGAFSPNQASYTVQNTGGSSVAWTASKTQSWVTLSSAGGTLAAGASATLNVTINSGANSLAAGSYSDTVTITNSTNGVGNTTRSVSLTVTSTVGALTVTPSGSLSSSGNTGGPFSPSQQVYALQNTGATSISWTAAKTQSWVTLSGSGGTLAGGASTNVTVSINSGANSLAAGNYSDTVTFTNTTNGTGNTTRAVSLGVSEPGATQTAASVSQYGITWTFDHSYQVGQFVNGDWWVVGPVTVTSITRPAGNNDRDGSMVNPTPSSISTNHGYDNEAGHYTASLNVAKSLPLVLSAGKSLISVLSWKSGDSGYFTSLGGYKVSYDTGNNVSVSSGSPRVITCANGWGSVTAGDWVNWNWREIGELRKVVSVSGSNLTVDINCTPGNSKSIYAGGWLRPVLRTAAVLTVMDQVPPSDAFRPTYAGSTKTIYRAGTLRWSSLPSLATVTGTPTLADYEPEFERVWLDHGTDYGFGESCHPSQNLAWYGQYNTQNYGDASLLMMLSNTTQAQKQTLMYRLVQVGIDTYGTAASGGIWPANGGHASGRKWPILFAGFMLNDANMLGVGFQNHTTSAWRFGEDEQTFYVEQSDVSNGVGYSSGDIGLPEWGIRHFYNTGMDSAEWTASYRQCCTAVCWSSQVLGARILGLQNNWNWPALFDYQDRYLATEPDWRFGNTFSQKMWERYRQSYP